MNRTLANEPPADFVHIHAHSHYSFLDGGCTVEKMLGKAGDLGMPAVAVTDHGNMAGAMDLYLGAHAAGLKPIIGSEVYVCPDMRDTNDNTRWHLVLLAQDLAGYRNLCKLVSAGYREGFYRKPRVDKAMLGAHSEGVIATSACLSGEVNAACAQDRLEDARRALGEYRDIYGDRFYLEVQNHGIAEQATANANILTLSREEGVPFIATNDSHYLDPEDVKAHDVLLCISTGSLRSDKNRFQFYNEQFYYKSQQEMWDTLTPEWREGMFTAAELATRIEPDYLTWLNKGAKPVYHLPTFPDLPAGQSEQEYLRELAYRGCEARYGRCDGDLKERMDYELGVIEEMGFPAYFLIVSDFIQWAKDQGIPVGPGRGSAAGSIVAYSLRITDVDPLRFGLLFERFLNKDRISMPDIDIDFCPQGRERVIDYVRGKYGEECVCQIVTFSQMKAKAVIRDVGRVLNVPLPDVDRITKLIPEAPKMTLKKAMDLESKLLDVKGENYQYQELFEIAERLEGTNRHTGIHAAGVIIAPSAVDDYVPLMRARRDEPLTTQYAMEHCEMNGLLKMDFLGLRNLTIIAECVAIIERVHGVKVDASDLPLDDAKTFAMLQRGDALGVFQLESDGMRKLLRQLKPDCFEDLIALLAMYRPGPLGSGMVEAYVDVKHGRKEAESQHPSIDPILTETNGVILYQEQVMRVAADMGGFTLNEADSLRKAMGKKRPEVMEKFKTKFIEGAEAQQYDGKRAKEIFELMEYFAGYGFNKSHSTAYAVVTYQTAWLKANYPVAFMAALITCEMGSTDKMVEYIEDATHMGITVRRPNIAEGRTGFTITRNPDTGEDEIVFGLGGVKGVGHAVIDAVVEERNQNGPFTNVIDFVERMDPHVMNKTALDALVRCGAVDALATPPGEEVDPNQARARLSAALESLMGLSQQAAKRRQQGKTKSLFGGDDEADDPGSQELGAFLPDVERWSDQELLEQEKDAIGFYVTSHPLAQHAEAIRMFATHEAGPILESKEDKAGVRVGGLITAQRVMTIKSGKSAGRKMSAFTLEDMTGSVECVAFADAFEKHEADIAPDAVVFVRGRTDFRQEDRPQVVVDEVIPIDKAREVLTKSLKLQLSADALADASGNGNGASSGDLLTRVRQAIADFGGTCPVYFEVRCEEGMVLIKAGPKWTVRPSADCLDAFSTIDGITAVIPQAGT